MATSSTVFFCKECGYESAKWLGKCPGCNNWNSFVEEKITKGKKSGTSAKGITGTFNNKSEVKKLNDIVVSKTVRLDSGYAELNRVLRRRFCRGVTYINRWRTRNWEIYPYNASM